MKTLVPLRAQPLHVALPVAAAPAFRALADIENLPRWAGEFCDRLEISAHGWRGWTACGDLFLELVADERTGVVDIQIGTEHELLAVLALRVLDVPPEGCVVTAVLLGSAAAHGPIEDLLALALRRLPERLSDANTVSVAAARVA